MPLCCGMLPVRVVGRALLGRLAGQTRTALPGWSRGMAGVGSMVNLEKNSDKRYAVLTMQKYGTPPPPTKSDKVPKIRSQRERSFGGSIPAGPTLLCRFFKSWISTRFNRPVLAFQSVRVWDFDAVPQDSMFNAACAPAVMVR